MSSAAPLEREPSPALAQVLARAARVVARVIAGESLNSALAGGRAGAPRRLQAATQDVVYEALRGYGRGELLLAQLTHRPLQSRTLEALLFVAMAQLWSKASPAHTLVDQAVEAAALLDESRARGLVNAVLRGYLRREGELRALIGSNPCTRYAYPAWWIERVQAAYPASWCAVLEQGNVHPPMTLRVNRRMSDPATYLETLTAAGIAATMLESGAVLLERPCPVDKLPGFAQGLVSVQDAAAQRAAALLDVRPGMEVLDACAAPGGKTAHILELCDCRVTAMDVSLERTRRIEESLTRLGLHADIVVGDACHAEQALPGRTFDRILLDAPCTASGVVRRHPDIRWLRRPSDVTRFAALQAEMMESLWRLLARDGTLLYATCSVFPTENSEQISAFAERHPDARRVSVSGTDDGQIVPGATNDGFYYACLSNPA